MKKSTMMLMAAALLCGANAYAQDNLMAGATDGATGNVAGVDAPLVKDGWQYWNCPYEYDAAEEEYFWGEPEDLTESWPDNVRLENPSVKGWNATYEDGSAFDGQFAMFRWDNGATHQRWYVYPVELPVAGIYNFNVLAGDFNNLNVGDSGSCYVKVEGFRVTLGKEVGPECLTYNDDWDDEEEFQSQAGVVMPEEGHLFTFDNGGGESPVMNDCACELTALEAGKYYIGIQGPHTIMAFADFSLTLLQEINSGVETVDSAATPVATAYYGIDGVKVVNPAKGTLVIEKTTMDNGSVKVAKKVVR